MSTTNLVQKAGWFSARCYENTEDPTIETGDFIKIQVGSFRPRFVINVEVFKVDSDGVISAPIAAALDLKFVKDPSTGLYNDFIKLVLPSGTSATGLRYRVFVME